MSDCHKGLKSHWQDFVSNLSDPTLALHPDARRLWNAAPRFNHQMQSNRNKNSVFLQGITGLDYGVGLVEHVIRNAGPKAPITVDINSPGGSSVQGLAIHNVLRRHRGKVTVNVLGQAMSAAQIITMAGDQINMGQGALQMFHNAWIVSVGDYREMDHISQLLKKVDGQYQKIIAARGNLSLKQVAKMSDKTTYMTPDQAIEYGLADGYMPDKTDDDSGNTAKSEARNQVSGPASEKVDLVDYGSLVSELNRVVSETRQLNNRLNV